MTKPYKPIVCIDFDGVIHSYTSGWKGVSNIPDPPVPGAIAALMAFLDAGFEVAIFSARSKSLRGRWAMKDWMSNAIADYWVGESLDPGVRRRVMGQAVDSVDDFSWPWFKPSAVVTIDDRAMCFNGNWLDYSPSEIRCFRTWQQKGTTRGTKFQGPQDKVGV